MGYTSGADTGYANTSFSTPKVKSSPLNNRVIPFSASSAISPAGFFAGRALMILGCNLFMPLANIDQPAGFVV